MLCSAQRHPRSSWAVPATVPATCARTPPCSPALHKRVAHLPHLSTSPALTHLVLRARLLCTACRTGCGRRHHYHTPIHPTPPHLVLQPLTSLSAGPMFPFVPLPLCGYPTWYCALLHTACRTGCGRRQPQPPLPAPATAAPPTPPSAAGSPAATRKVAIASRQQGRRQE